MEKAILFGYEVYENGDIYKEGKKINYQKTISVLWKGKFWKNVSYARFVYYAFHQEDFDFDNRSFCVKHKDNNNENNWVYNLYATNTKEYLRGANNKMSKLNQDQVKEIIHLYKEGQDKSQSLNNPIKKVSYRSLAKAYGVNHNVIRRIIKESEE